VEIASTSQMIRDARLSAGLTQAQLAERSATSQATLSAYERGHKVPVASTLARILAAAGYRLTASPARRAVVTPGLAEHERVAGTLVDVIALAGALPTAHRPEIAYPRLTDVELKPS
jgi:transcriptional regulator with XRE-family HTH domain